MVRLWACTGWHRREYMWCDCWERGRCRVVTSSSSAAEPIDPLLPTAQLPPLLPRPYRSLRCPPLLSPSLLSFLYAIPACTLSSRPVHSQPPHS